MATFWHRVVALFAAFTMLLATAAGASAQPPAGDDTPPPPSPQPASAGTSATVTLITGDRVRIAALGDGREAVEVIEANTIGSVQTFEIGGDLYAIPDAAQPYLATNALDRELFNVSNLVAYGYDDESTDATPLILQYDGRSRAAGPAVPEGATVEAELDSIDGAAVVADHDETADLWSDITDANSRTARPGRLGNNLKKVWLDGQVTKTLDSSVPIVGAPEAWDQGYLGVGATVAVLDTGYDPTHPDLMEAVVKSESFVPGETVEDLDGHGTHVASTVAGSGAASEGKYVGVAPGADLLIGKVLGNTGTGQDSWVIAGMEWAAANADVVNMSLGDNSVYDQDNPMAQAVNSLTAETDTLFVIAAGNLGREGTVHSPGTADAALTVGATDDFDRLAYFSSQGPRALDGALKPDISAPGVAITAARSQLISYGSGLYTTLQGTSMAAPHVAGAAAIVAAAHPDWSAQRIKNALMSRSAPLPDYNLYQAGMGRLDVPSALGGVSATGSVYFGMIYWGDPLTGTATATVTYENSTDADVDLFLDPTGAEGLVTLSTNEITVPAGGSVEVEASVDRAQIPSTGAFLGEVVATDSAGATVARTGTGIVREAERYNLDVSVKDRSGAPTAAIVTLYRYGTTNILTLGSSPTTGRVPTQRVEPGIYSVHVWLDVPGENGRKGLALLHQPHVVVEGSEVLIELDASKANQVGVETPEKSMPTDMRTEFWHDAGIGGSYTTFLSGKTIGLDTDFYAQPTGPIGGADYAFAVQFQASAPFGDFRADTPSRSPFNPLYQRGSIRLDGTVNLEVVDGGSGTPEEIVAANPGGKAVLVRQNPSVSPFLRGNAAANTGTALMVIVSDGPDQAIPYEFAGTRALPVVGVTKAEGDALLAAVASGGSGNVRIKGNAVAYPEYGYDLYQRWSEVPEDPVFRPAEGDLAAVVDRTAMPVDSSISIARYSCPAYLLRCQGVSFLVDDHAERTDWVTAGNEWVGTLSLSDLGTSRTDERRSYEPGESVLVDWTGGVTSPHSGGGTWLSYSSGQRVAVNIPTASGPGLITGSIAGTSATSKLYQDGELVGTRNSQSVQTLVPAVTGPHTYRFDQTTSRGADRWPLSTATASSWTFQLTQTDDYKVLPLLHVDYQLTTDLNGVAAKAGQPFDIGIRPRHEAEAAAAGSVTEATLEVSADDGATWQPVELTAADGVWSASVDTPREAATMSLRVTAADSAGNSVSQEVIGAVLLDRVPANE